MKLTVIKSIFAIFLFIVFFGYLSTDAYALGTTYYVSTTGNDSTGNGSLSNPFATVNKAQNYVKPGDTVFVRGGTYFTAINLTKGSGLPDAYVTYKSYPGETAIIDGANLRQTQGQSLIAVNNLKYITIEGFEVRNTVYTDSTGKIVGGGRGINVYSNSTTAYSEYVTIKNNKVYNTYDKGIGGAGMNITIDGNEVYYAAKKNFEGASISAGWPTGISTYFMTDSAGKLVESRNINITNNYVHETWGEGIDAIALNGGKISGNRVKDTFSVLIYLDNSRNITIDGNYLSAVDQYYFRGGLPARGIQISGESCCVPSGGPYEHENIVITNNLIVNTKAGIRYWLGNTNKPYRNLKIWHNTIVNPVQDAGIYLDNISSSGNEVKNNIIYKGATIPNSSAWTFSNNNWPNGKPSIDTSSTSFSSDPMFVNPIVAGPADGYKLNPASSSIGKGSALQVFKDYFGSPRSQTPTLGFYEYVGNTSQTSSPTTSTKMGDANGDNQVNEIDFTNYWLVNYSKSVSCGVSCGDFNNNNVVDGVDYAIWLMNYNK